MVIFGAMTLRCGDYVKSELSCQKIAQPATLDLCGKKQNENENMELRRRKLSMLKLQSDFFEQ